MILCLKAGSVMTKPEAFGNNAVNELIIATYASMFPLL
jgi:hypothetical protein